MKNKILIVDDALFMRSMLRKILTEMGVSVILEAEDGERACQICREEKPDLVLLDITMPKLNGIETLKLIKSENPDIHVIMCSAMGQESIIIDALHNGADDFIVKPFKKESIQEIVLKAEAQPEGEESV